MSRRRRARQGEVWIVALDPTTGSEIRKTRPCVVVSPDSMNESLRTVVIVPLTSGSRPAPFRVPCRFTKHDGLLLCDHVKSVSAIRFRSFVGTIDPLTLRATLAVLREMFET